MSTMTREVIVPPPRMSGPARVALLALILAVGSIGVQAARAVRRMDRAVEVRR